MSVRVADELIVAVASALSTTAARAAAVRDESHRAMVVAVSEIERERDMRRANVSRAEADLTAAAHDLARCQAMDPPCDCAGPARRQVQCIHRLDEARRSLEAAQRAVGDVHVAQAELAGAARRLTEDLEAADKGSHYVTGLLTPLSEYRRVGVPSAGSSASSTSVPNISSAAKTIAGLQLVDLDDIDDSDSTVSGPATFTKLSYADAQWATEALEDAVLPALRAGKDRDYLAQRDVAEGRAANRSYARLYDTYFGSTAITLEARADGRLGVVGGYHRIWAARQAGVGQLPARVHR